ncbi:MAG: hypothetical protein OEM62_01870 [Acidobacteriota bacterium]|nr:hypothetical protein [Acidobacteriota bacterium]
MIGLLSVSSAATAQTVYSYTSQPGDFIGQGQSAVWTEADGRWTISRNFDNGADFVFRATDFSSNWNLRFAAPNDVEITPGSYPGAMTFPATPPAPGLWVFGEGRSCSPITGQFDVSEVIYDWYGRPVRFAATFTQTCPNTTASLLGSIDHTFGLSDRRRSPRTICSWSCKTGSSK